MSLLDRILREINDEFAFVKSKSLETFATQLKNEDELFSIPTIYPQLTCKWFIEGLDFIAPEWRYD